MEYHQTALISEEKLRKIKNDPDILTQLAAKREACMRDLINDYALVDEDILSLDEPVPNSQLLRAIAPQRQALNQGELVDLVRHDQLKDDDSDPEVNRDQSDSTIGP